MGAWGAGNFENDTALDWVEDLARSTDLSLTEDAISTVLNNDDYLDADLGCIGLAAVEVIAALRNKPAADLPEEVAKWVRAHRIAPSEALIKDCLAAIDKIRTDDNSELRELWEEVDSPPSEWHSVLDGLVTRLG